MTARRGTVVFIMVVVLIDSIGFGLVIPVLPKLIMTLTGAGVDRAAQYGGWLGFVYAFMQFFCAPILGNLSDRFGRRPVLLLALLALGLDYLIMGSAPVLSWLFVGRLISGAAGASYTPAYAYVADITPADQRAHSFGLMGAAFGVGFILGPALGGLLGTLGPRAPFYAAGALALLNAMFGYFVLPESLMKESRRRFDWSRANPIGTLTQVRRYPTVLWMLGAVFLYQLGHQVLPSVWSFYTMSKFGWTAAQIGYSLAFVGAVMAVSQGALTRTLIPKLGGERRATLVGMLAMIGQCVGYAFGSAGWMMYVVSLCSLVSSIAYPALNALMSQQMPADSQGELQGAVAGVVSVSAIVGPPLMTQTFGYFSSKSAVIYFPGAAFLLSAVLMFCAALLYARGLREVPRQAVQAA